MEVNSDQYHLINWGCLHIASGTYVYNAQCYCGGILEFLVSIAKANHEKFKNFFIVSAIVITKHEYQQYKNKI